VGLEDNLYLGYKQLASNGDLVRKAAQIVADLGGRVLTREKEIGGSGGSLEPPGPLLTHLHIVYMACSERLPTRLTPLAERACFSFPLLHLILSYYAEGCMASCMRAI
jgi:hypothetical protein